MTGNNDWETKTVPFSLSPLSDQLDRLGATILVLVVLLRDGF